MLAHFRWEACLWPIRGDLLGMTLSCRVGVAAAALLLSTALQAAAGEPRRVLLLHSYGPHFAPWSAVSGRFREELIKQSPNAIDLYGLAEDRTPRAGSR